VKPLPFLGGGLAGKSVQVTAQRKLNVYLEHRPDGDKGVKVVCYGTPGMRLLFTVNTPLSAPIRGILGCSLGLFAVSGATFVMLTATGSQSYTAAYTSSSNLVSMAATPTQLALADGNAGRLYTAAGGLVAIGGAYPQTARTITNVSTFFVAEQPGSQNFWVSNSGDGTTWNGLSFGGAGAYGDNILAVDNLLGNLIVFSASHMEFWQNVGSTPQPFAPIVSAVNEWGLGALFSRAHANQCIYFLGATRSGQLQVCQLSGYNVTVISTPDVDFVINSLAVTSDAVALTYQQDASVFYQLTFPSANRTLLLNTSNSIWSEAQTGHTTAYAARHVGNLSGSYLNQTFITDANNGNVYTPDPNYFTDNGVVIERELVMRHAIEGYNEFTVDEIYLDMEQGVGLTTGQGSNPMIMLRVSRDSGHTYETEQWVPVGQMGQYGADGNRVVWQRQGSARIFTSMLRYTEPTKFVIANGAMTVRATKRQ
jgi:hypothetical protein